ncbi:MAG: hypothetical protein WA116_07200 [Anaerolineaceae bacterium]
MKKKTRFLFPILLLVAGIVIAGVTLLKPNKVESQEYAPFPTRWSALLSLSRL